MRFVLDTNTVSFLMKGHPGIAERLMAESRTDVLLPQPVLAEIEYGLAHHPVRRRREALRRRFDLIRGQLSGQDWTDGVSRVFGEVKADLHRRGLPLEDFDVAIAAHAIAIDAALVTENLAHMERIRGLRLENWRQGSQSQ